MYLRWTVRLAVAGALYLVSGCGSSTPALNPTPQITGLFPSEITAGSQAFTIFVSGTQFLSTSTAQWNGSDRPSVFNQASTQLAVSITAADVQNAGLGEVTVTSPAPGGGTSLAVSFSINPAHSDGPTITSLSPSSAALNGPAFTLTVNGTNFSPSDYVTWNGGLRETCPPPNSACSSTQLTAQILASDLTQQMTAGVAVHTSQLGIASPSVSFQVGNAPSSNARFPQIISINAQGGAADGLSSSPAASAGGRYVAFYSEAKNLVSGRMPDGTIPRGTSGNVFVRDTCLGVTGCVPRTVAVDVGSGGVPPNASVADQVAISADGRYVAFTSNATNLVSNTAASQPVPRVFVRDVCMGSSAPAGCSPQTQLVSVNADGQATDGAQPTVSADGRFVAFTAPMTPGNPGSLVMVRDTCRGATAAAGCTPRTVVASVNDGRVNFVVPRAQAVISASGRYVAFASASHGAEHSQILLRDTCLGVSASESCAPSTARVSAAPDGQIANADSRLPSISADGRFVVFESAASNLADTSAAGRQIYLRDTCAGSTAPFGCLPSTTQILSSDTLTEDAAGSYSPAISASGRYISYIVQTATQKATSASGTTGYVVVYDTCFGAKDPCSPHSAELPVASSLGGESPLIGDIRMRVPVTNDGRFAAFFTQQTLPALHTSGFGDVFLTTTPFQAQQ
ncbi:MAG TPA: IPT/TIG domain-containing protein [Candidatus Acidoferrales bacterium]|nr:IPT/TIG domain-containing protein [Candidatus Acidoferrales bacterium]